MSDSTVFVTAEAAAQQVETGAWKVLDARYSLQEPSTYGKRMYEQGHLPGAVFADCEENLCVPPKARDPAKGRHPLPDAETFIRWCLDNGIDGSTPVLVYDNEGGPMCAARCWWMLTSLGAPAFILNGGYPAWAAKSLPTSTDVPPHSPLTEWKAGSVWTLVETDPHEMLAFSRNPHKLFIDARPPPRFGSTVRAAPVDPLPGHIPGALNLAAISFVDGGVLKDSKERLSAVFQSRAHMSRDTIFSCGSGITGCMPLAVTQHCGLGRGRLYSGSWSEFAVVHKDTLTKDIIEREGVLVKMVTANLDGVPLPDAPDAAVFVDDAKLSGDWREADAPVRKALETLRVGEEAELVCASVTHRVRVATNTP